MTNLSDRVQKAKELEIKTLSVKGAYSVYGSQNDYYEMRLSKETVISQFGNKDLDHLVFICQCCRYDGVGLEYNCKGNECHTVCYHCLGAIVSSLEANNMRISFYENIFDAVRGLSLGKRTLVQVISTQSNGSIWATIERKPEKVEQYVMELPKIKTKLLNNLSVNLMRGSENDEGID